VCLARREAENLSVLAARPTARQIVATFFRRLASGADSASAPLRLRHRWIIRRRRGGTRHRVGAGSTIVRIGRRHGDESPRPLARRLLHRRDAGTTTLRAPPR